ncbi:MAG: Rrf2 family transcriptional regulator [Campylobacter sp.]|nr:Rrf2 family transcriptional regulator [Campylobacter sp.]
MIVGEAGSLFTDETRSLRVMDAPDFPKAYLPTAIAMLEAYEVLIKRNATYTYLSPALFFEIDRPKTGKYKVGGDFVVLNSKGESVIGYADYAVAMVDGIENAKFINQRFCVVEA